MPLLKNSNQPYFPDPNSPNTVDCNGSYCYPINQGDYIKQQWYQTPCGNNEVTDPTFGNYSLGADMITNGSFTGLAAGWTLSGNWVYGTNNVECTSGLASELEQLGVGLVVDNTYRITFDLVRSAGAVYVAIDAGAGTIASTYFQETGTVTVDLYLPVGLLVDKIRVITDTDFIGSVDNITMKLVTYTDWVQNATWAFGTTEACANATGTDPLEEAVADYITVGDYYQLTFTVSDVTAGSVTPYIANMPGTAITANGTYTIYETPTLTGVVSFVPTADFVGCISAPDLRALRNDYTFEVVNEDGDRYSISNQISYVEDKVILDDQIFDRLELPYACYTIEVTDKCLVEGVELITNGTFSDGSTGWTLNNGAYQYDFSGGQLEWTFDPFSTGTDVITNGDFSAGNSGWTFAGWTIGTDATHTPGNTSPLTRSITLSPPVTPPTVLHTWISITMSGRTAGSITITLSDKTSLSYADNGTWAFRLAPTIGGVVSFTITPTSTFDGTIDDIVVQETSAIWAESPVVYNAANADIVAGNYEMSFEIISITANGTPSVAPALLGMTQGFTRYTTVGVHTLSIPNYTPGAQVAWLLPSFGQTDSAGGGRSLVGTMVVDNVSLVRVEPFEATYVSECMNYQFSHLNTKLISGWCDQDAFGFDFPATGFELQMRTEIRSLNPIYNKNKNVAQFGTGDAAIKYADQAKYWQLVTGYMSESAHDALSVILDCDHFAIGTSDADRIEYIAEVEDYQPQWIQSGSYSLAPIIINLRLKTGGMKFNRHT